MVRVVVNGVDVIPRVEERAPCVAGHGDDEECDLCAGTPIDIDEEEKARGRSCCAPPSSWVIQVL